MKTLLRTFLVIIFVINFSLPLFASQHSSVTEEGTVTKESTVPENGISHKNNTPLEEETKLKAQEKELSFHITITIAIIVIMIIALGTIGVVFLVISKGSRKISKDKKKPVADVEYQAAESKSFSNEEQMKNIPEAELRDLSQVTDKDSLEVRVPFTSIGREYGNDIIIPKNTVSSRHATIEYRNGYFYLVDHRSSNGSFINGSKVETEGKLKSGDLIAFDVFKFQFILPTLTALGQPQSQTQSQYSVEDNRMTILRPQQRSAGSNSKSKGSQQNFFRRD